MTSTEIDDLRAHYQQLSPEARDNCDSFLQIREELTRAMKLEARQKNSGVCLTPVAEELMTKAQRHLFFLMGILVKKPAVRRVAGFEPEECDQLEESGEIADKTREKILAYIEDYLAQMADEARKKSGPGLYLVA